jgi:DNA-binding CsgD family transcriptional regulator
MDPEIVGREAELESIGSWCDAVPAGARSLVLEGEAGIGKSTLWRAAIATARARGWRVLCAQPAEAERGLALAGLGDLLEPILDEVLPLLPPPRRRALEVALLLEQAERPLDRRAVGVAVRTAVEELAARRPLLLAIDDVQWLDPSSAAALVFALRRVEREPIALLLARRLEEGIGPSELERVLEPERLRVGPLTLGALQALLHRRLARPLPRPSLLRLHESSGGNPFYALELARVLPQEADPTQPLPLPYTLEALLRARLDRLPGGTRDALALVACAGRPTVARLRRAGIGEDDLEPALAAHVLERRGEHLRFAHPLLATALDRGLRPSERRRIHRLLAGVVEEQLSRARHLALAAESADAATAAQLEEAAAVAKARGVPIAAAELAEHALRLTPDHREADAHRRTLVAVRANLAGGDASRARSLARQLFESADPGRRRIEALFLLADAEGNVAHPMSDWVGRFAEALPEAAGDPALEARVRHQLACLRRFIEGPGPAEPLARKAVELAESAGDAALTAEALGTLALTRAAAGKADALELAERACAYARGARDEDALARATLARNQILLESGSLERARVALEQELEESRTRSEWRAADAYAFRSILEFHAGEFRTGAEHAARHLEIAEQYGWDDPVWAWDVAGHAAHAGRLDEAREIASRGRTVPIVARCASEGVLGLVELWSGDLGRGVGHFAEADRVRTEAGQREPHLYWWRPDQVEALLELGRINEALALLDGWEAEAVRLGRARILAQVACCRGRVAAARGEVGEAIALLDEAARRHEALGDRYQRGRALLALGGVRRRARQKRAAREAIEQALALFEGCGSEVFAARARAELGSIGGRRREEGLTSAERRVAALAAEGKTNREVAAALFLGERTVATHLSHVYAKLGVRSRTELARTLH